VDGIDQRRRHVGLGGVMIDDVRLELFEDDFQVRVANVALEQGDGRIEIGAGAGREIIDDGDFVSRRAEAVGDVRADKARPAGDQYSHAEV
jgi:hypothetical protein